MFISPTSHSNKINTQNSILILKVWYLLQWNWHQMNNQALKLITLKVKRNHYPFFELYFHPWLMWSSLKRWRRISVRFDITKGSFPELCVQHTFWKVEQMKEECIFFYLWRVTVAFFILKCILHNIGPWIYNPNWCQQNLEIFEITQIFLWRL